MAIKRLVLLVVVLMLGWRAASGQLRQAGEAGPQRSIPSVAPSPPPSEAETKPTESAEPAKPPPVSLMVSVRSDKAIYKDGEHVRMLGRVINVAGMAVVPSIVAVSIYRVTTNASATAADSPQYEMVYRTLIEPKDDAFADDGYVVQFPTAVNASFAEGKHADFLIEAIAVARVANLLPGPVPYAQTSFGAEQVSGFRVMVLVLYPALIAILILILVYFAFMSEASKRAVRRTLFVVYVASLACLLGAMCGPLFISASPSVEALLRAAPVGIAKATSNNAPFQWVINIGGTLGSENTFTGGFAVPLFIVILGLVGGSISMLLKLPEFLHDYDWLRDDDAGEADVKAISELRAGLFRQFIYIVTAPFLCIVVFSMATLADYTNPYALSIVAFAVGFTTEQIVKGMVHFVGGVVNQDATPTDDSDDAHEGAPATTSNGAGGEPAADLHPTPTPAPTTQPGG